MGWRSQDGRMIQVNLSVMSSDSEFRKNFHASMNFVSMHVLFPFISREIATNHYVTFRLHQILQTFFKESHPEIAFK